MYETTRQRVCKWLLLAVLVFSTLDAALFAFFDIGMERLRFSAADLGAQALAFAKDLVTFVTAGLPIGLMRFWKGRGY